MKTNELKQTQPSRQPIHAVMLTLLLLWSLLAFISTADGFMSSLSPRVGIRSRRGRVCVSMAADVDDEGYVSWLSKKVERAQRPPFVKIARARLTRDFAVLLMRSSYQVCDDLDFVPMDDFQKQFFLFRQGEWLDYKENFPRIKQGDLTDPDYFDFISFAQYASVAMAIRNGRDIFEEKVGAEGEKRTVQRDPEFKDNGLLPDEHARRVGDRILAYCTETFGETKLAPVVGQGLSVPELQEGCERIMNLLRLNFYLLDYTVGSDLGRGLITVKATAPATIWGQQVLVRRKDRPTNDFEAKTVLAYLRACGIGGATYSTAFNGLDAIHTFRL